MPERGEKPSSVHRRLWRVVRIRRTDEARVADLVQDQAPEAERQTASRAVDDLVVVVRFKLGSPWENRCVESFNGNLRDKLLGQDG